MEQPKKVSLREKGKRIWNKYKWWIIGGAIALGGGATYLATKKPAADDEIERIEGIDDLLDGIKENYFGDSDEVEHFDDVDSALARLSGLAAEGKNTALFVENGDISVIEL